MMRKVIGLALLSALVLGFSGCSDSGKSSEESEIDRMVKEEFDANKKNEQMQDEVIHKKAGFSDEELKELTTVKKREQ